VKWTRRGIRNDANAGRLTLQVGRVGGAWRWGVGVVDRDASIVLARGESPTWQAARSAAVRAATEIGEAILAGTRKEET